MRLAERLVNGESLVGASAEVADDLRACVRVNADQAASWFWGTDDDMADLFDTLGPVTPPFDLMWIDYEMPPQVTAEGTTRNSPFASAGSLVGFRDGKVYLSHVIYAHGTAGLFPAFDVISLHDDGRPDDWQMLALEEDPRWADIPDDFRARATWHMAMVALLSLSFMHCRNVEVAQFTPTRKVRDHKGKRRHYLDYGVIKIPGRIREASRADGARESAAGAQPLHLVRGHFKTFTEEAPLFGTRTGTYWWGWQARGSKKHGRNVRDYEA